MTRPGPLGQRRKGGAGVMVAVATLFICTACGDSAVSRVERGGAGAAQQAFAAVTPDDFAGSDACAGCHAEQYNGWAASTHGRAGGEPGPGTVIAPFDGTPIVFRDGTVLPVVDPVGDYVFVVRQEGRPEQSVRVDGVIGGGHMLGGGTQGFVSHLTDGTARFLPFDYSRQLDAWFCNTGSRTNEGWVPITAEMAMADCGDWPPARVLGTISRFANCQSCHGSQITARLEAGEGVTTRWTSLDINCESCHGPARAHVELMSGGNADGGAFAGDIGLESRVTDGVEESLNVCFGCHALKDVVQEGYLPGAELADFYALKLPVLGDDPYLPDGRVKTFAYQATHLSSSCYVDGNMTCVSCHEPHGLGYWDINRQPLASETDDRQCTSCHAAKAADPEAHTFHPVGSSGAMCVSCHMPYLQHPEVGPTVPFARSDHTIPVPRPQLDGRLGLVSACRGCHTDRSEIGLQAQVDEWWGETKPHDRVTAGLLAVTGGMGADLAARMLLHPDDPGEMAQFQGLARFLTQWVLPGAGLGVDAMGRVTRLAGSEDADLRALALATLAVAEAGGAVEGPAVRDGAGDATTSAIAEEPLALRRRVTMILGFLSDEALARDDVGTALALLDHALAILPGDPGILRSQGLAHNQTGDYASAIASFSESLAVDPGQPLGRVNMGIARAASGDANGAIQEYRAAIALNPNEPLAWFNLGNIHLRSDDLASAIRFYESAVAVGPELSRAHLNLAIALARAGRVEEAITHGRLAVEFAPGDETAREVLQQLDTAR